MKYQQGKVLIAGLAASAMVFAACGDDGGSSSTTAAPATTAAPGTTAAPATTAAPGTTAAPATTAGGGVLVENQPDTNKDGKVQLAVISSGDLSDKGYYQAVADKVTEFSTSQGWEAPILVGSVKPGDALNTMRDLCRQKPDMIVIGTPLDLADGVPVSEEPDCQSIAFYAQGVAGVKVTDYIGNAGDNRFEILYTAGVAAGVLVRDAGGTKAGLLLGPEAPTFAAYPVAYELGVKSVVPNAEVVTTYTGDFNDSARAVEAAKAQISAGVSVIYPFLGGATGAVYKEAIAAGIPTLTPGTDRCADPTAKPAVSVAFDPGLYVIPALEQFAKGEYREGVTRVFRLGVDPVPYIKFCNPAAGQQEVVDAAVAKIVSGEIDPKALVEKAMG